MKTGFKKYDSSYKRKESPFTRLSVGIGITTGPRNLERRRREEQRKYDEANKEKLLAKAKGRLIKKAERKERKAAKKREYAEGNTAKLGISRKMAEKAAARKTRKATKLRKQAGELTADQVVRRREQMRDNAETRQKRNVLNPSPTPFTSKKLLKKVSSQLKAASKKHAGQAAKIDKTVSSMKMKTPMKKISGPCKAAAKRKFKVWPSAYASGWGVRCTKAGGPSKFGG